jgi:hypothetical protein
MGLHICRGFALAEVLGMAVLDRFDLPEVVEFSHERYGQLVVNILFFCLFCAKAQCGELHGAGVPCLTVTERETFVGA